jgi:protein-S-isoprenylcysteine O-methyltransferase Ste14
VIGAVVVGLGFLGPRWPAGVRTFLLVAGLAAAAAGLGLLVAGGAFLGRSLSPFPRPLEGASLRQHGVYGIVRHPMYGGAIAMAFGWALATTPAAFGGAVVLGAYLELKSRREEVWLAERYPAYDAYRRRTRWRFLPGLR